MHYTKKQVLRRLLRHEFDKIHLDYFPNQKDIDRIISISEELKLGDDFINEMKNDLK